VVQESALELLAVAFNHTVWVLPKHLHLPSVPLTHLVALEAVLISALLLAQLAVPPQFAKALGLDARGNLQGGQQQQAADSCMLLGRATLRLHRSGCHACADMPRQTQTLHSYSYT
jgi:hypothetical protein